MGDNSTSVIVKEDYIHSLPDKERFAELELRKRLGYAAPTKDGVITELGESIKDAAMNVGAGFGSTLEETLGTPVVADYFNKMKLVNQDVRPDASYSATNFDPASLARTIGTGVTQSGLSIGAGLIATAATGGNPIAGTAAMGTVMFAQTYGDTVKDYRAAMPGQDEKTVKSLAFISAAGQSLLESVLGPEAMAAGVTKGIFTSALKETTKELSAKFGASAAKQLLYKTAVGAGEGALGEGTEEVMQLYWDKLIKSQGTGKSELPQWDEVKENFFGGAIPGAVMGGGISAMNKNAKIDPALGAIPVKTVTDAATGEKTTMPPVQATTNPPVDTKMVDTSAALAESIAQDLGIKVKYYAPGENETETEIKNGEFNPDTNEIMIDRSGLAQNPLESLGHEFKHYLDKNHADLMEAFNTSVKQGLTEEGMQQLRDTKDTYRGKDGNAINEFSADTFGKFWTDGEFWKDVTLKAEEKQAGMGQKFIDALTEFVKMAAVKLKKIGTPEAKVLFDNLQAVRNNAVEAMAEYKKRQGSQVAVSNNQAVTTTAQNVSAPIVTDTSAINLNEEEQKKASPELFGNSEQVKVENGKRVLYSISGQKENIPKKDIESYRKYLDERMKSGVLILTANDRKSVEQFYNDFPLGDRIKNRWGEEIIFAPSDLNKTDDYIQHFAVKRAGKNERFIEDHKILFENLRETLKNPDERILTENKNGDRRICFTKNIRKNGNHYVVTAIAENGYLLPWTHMDSKDSYIQNQRDNEKACVEKYGVVDKNGIKIDVSYKKYMELKKDMPLYLATAQTYQKPFPQADVSDGNSIIQQSVKEVKGGNDKKMSITRKNQQVNPIREAGTEQDMYQDNLDAKKYDVKPNAELNEQASRRIAADGGVQGAIDRMLNGDAKITSDVAQRAAQIILNSEEYKALSPDEKVMIADEYIKSGTEAGRNLASRRLGALDMGDIISIQAHINAMLAKINKKIPTNDLRQEILDKLGIDIHSLPDDIVNNPKQLDQVIRNIQSASSTIWDKWYELWINGILSGITTHASNIMGNTANMVYELGAKRMVEAALNLAVNQKNGATFSEFKDMWKAFDSKTAWQRAKEAFDLEALTADGKLEGRMRAAIGGKTGRVVRIPGRFLRAADEFSKALIIPIEATAYAHREGVKNGLEGKALNEYITAQLNNETSKSNEYASLRAKELTFQEDPGGAVKQLMILKEQGGISGILLRYILPFMKTPMNLLNQGVRKSPLGVFKLGLYETPLAMLGKREFDTKYIQHVAEQILAWGAVAALMSLDDDELPFITGSSPRYGTAEQKFKVNKVPPYSIRIGDTYYSYKRIEPIATGLAVIADGMQVYKDIKNGKDGTAITKRLLLSAVQLISEKSFLDSIGEATKIAMDPEANIIKFGTNFASSWMPNVVRQTITIFDDNVSDNKSRARGSKFLEDQFQIITNRMGLTQASPKIDYFGREITKDALADGGTLSPLMRLIPITPIAADGNMDKAETLIWNYNQSSPNDQYYPDVPAYYGMYEGKKIYFEGQDYQDYAIEAGKLAHKQINNAIKHGLLNVNKPDEEDIKLIKKIFQRARKETKEKFVMKKRYTAE